jgi:hypothetical protein
MKKGEINKLGGIEFIKYCGMRYEVCGVGYGVWGMGYGVCGIGYFAQPGYR